ncbi:TIGR02594 family protein [Rhizobium sp. NFR07]|uniref:hypothetical protein n=1 Tax=Rhizobium sp. NFR07 TaxID=1566262 RepID=UPI0008E8F119|nr:hypothetical protein [Rhizobium sp. NFR07]SFB52259.1 TIGR02594 family protein [Rhizobium sp. NFR07]
MAVDNSDDLIISISTDQATLRRSIKRIEQDLGTLAGSVKKQFDNVGRSVDSSLTTSLQNRINGMVGIGTSAAKEWTGALADQGKELERLRARYSPLFNTINNYKSAVADIKRAHALGAISADEMATAISRERQAALASTAAIKGRNQALQATVTMSRGNSFNTSNLAAQGFDVAATAAFMPWYTVALQQGPQVAQVFNDIRASGERIGPAVAGAFMQLVNPISLITIGAIGATAAAVAYFSGVLSDSNSASEKLKEQAQLIQSVADKWGDAVPALREYAEQLARAQDAADLKAGVALINEKTLEDTKKQLEDARISVSALVQDLRSAGEADEVIKRLQSAFEQFAKSAADGKLEAQDVKSVQDALAAAINSSGIPALADWKKMFDELSTSALSASENVGKVNDAASRNLPVTTWRSYNPATGKPETNAQPWDENIQNPGFMTPEVGPVPQGRPLRELEALPTDKKAETAAQRSANAYRDLKKSADDRLAQMQQEIDLLGKFGIEADTARFALDLFQQAEDKGRSLSEAQRAELEKKVALYKQYSAELAKAKLSQDLLEQRRYNSMTSQDQQIYTTLKQYGLPTDMNSQEAGQIRQSQQLERQNEAIDQFADSLANGIVNSGGDIGKAFGEVFLNELKDTAQKQLSNVLGQLFKAIMTGGGNGSPIGSSATSLGGGLLSSVFGGKTAGAGAGGAVDKASALLGANERSNAGSINAYLKQGGVDINAAQTAWCAAFVNSSLEQIGVKGSGSLTANSFQNWGSAVDPGQVLRGDVLLQSRGLGADQAGGHVGLATGSTRMAGGQLQLEMLSGNSGNAVTNAWVNASELQVKRATSAADALGKLADSSGAATQGLGQLGQLSTSFFPAAPSAPSGGGGVGGLGGIFSGLFGGGLSAAQIAKYTPMVGLFADGGDVRGPGTGTSDSIPAMLSNGEFVVRASATKKHLALLRAINSGQVGRFAEGGLVTPASVPSAPALRSPRAAANDNGQPGVLVVRIDGANGDDHVRMLVQQGVSDGLGQYNQSQQRSGFGSNQQKFTSMKG